MESFFCRRGFARLTTGADGCLVRDVYIMGISFGDSDLRNSTTYEIDLECCITGGYDFKMTLDYDRISLNPRITKRPICGDVIFKELPLSYQEARSSFSVSAKSIKEARDILCREICFAVPDLEMYDGLELAGGRDSPDYEKCSFTSTFSIGFRKPPYETLCQFHDDEEEDDETATTTAELVFTE